MATVYFGSSVLRGAAVDAADTTISLELKVAGRSWSRSLALTGPGDVTSVDASAITRVWPPRSTRNIEPNMLAFVELADPALPWLMSPATAAKDRVVPWLSLLVLTESEHERFRLGDDRIQLRGRPVPTVDNLWAWAHVQAEARHVLASDGVARIVNWRRLQPKTLYHALLVPTFRATAIAMLGDGASSQTSELSWAMPSAIIPVIDAWSFETGDAGDFESLARSLALMTASSRADAMTLGRFLPGTTLRRVALSPLGTVVSDFSPTSATTTRLAKLLDGTLVGHALPPPKYGEVYVAPGSIPDPARTTWFDRLNVDPALRAAAGVGARIVRESDEVFVASAWEQLQGTVTLNRNHGTVQLGRELAQRTMTRLVAPRRRPSKAFVAKQIETSLVVAPPVFDAIGSHPWQRVLRPRGPLAHKVEATTRVADVYETWTPTLVDPPIRSVVITPYAPKASFPRTTTTVTRWKKRGQATTPHTLSAADTKSLSSHVSRLEQRDLISPDGWLAWCWFSVWNYLDPAATLAEMKTWFGMPLDGGIEKRIAEIEPGHAYGVSKRNRPPGKLTTQASLVLPGDALDPVTRTPTFGVSVFDLLRSRNPDWFFPQIDSLPENGYALVAVDTAFIESLLVGLNDEMGRELAWRGYPAARNATYFRTVLDPNADIRPIASWTKPIGSNTTTVGIFVIMRGELLRRYPGTYLFATKSVGGQPSASSDDQRAPIVHGLLRSDVACFGFALTESDVRSSSGNEGWFFGLAETETSLRFGLDDPPGATAGSATYWSDLSWGNVPTTATGWIDLAGSLSPPPPAPNLFSTNLDANSATIARVLAQKPYVLLRHADDFLRRKP